MPRPVKSPYHPSHIGSWLALAFLWTCSKIPLPLLYHIGTFLGDLLGIVVRSRRLVAEKNLSICFPEKRSIEIKMMARENVRQTARMVLYTGFVWWSSEKKIANKVKLTNIEYLDELINSNKNVILLAPHFLALELGGIYLSTRNPGVSVYQRTRNSVFDKTMLKARQRFGGTIYERKSDLKNMIRAIKSGLPCYYLPDQDPGPRRAIFAPFFGVPSATWPVLGRLANLGSATVLPCTTYLQPRGRGFEIILDKPLKNFPSDDIVEDVTLMNKAIEKCIRRHPTQYFWVHKRFKTRPPGIPDPYI